MKARHYAFIGAFAASLSLFSPSPASAGVPGDVVVNFDDPKNLVSLSFGGSAPTQLQVTKASLSIATPDPTCVSGPSCQFTLNHLVVGFGDFFVDVTLNGTPAQFNSATPVALIEGNFPLVVGNSSLIIPGGDAGTPSTVSADISGGTNSQSIPSGPRTNVTTLPEDFFITLDAVHQKATIDGTFNFTIPVQGVTIAGTATVLGTNASPFVNLPPVANAGAAQTLVCPGLATLNATGSTDPENNIAAYQWATSAGGIENGSPIAQFFFGPGTTTATVTVTDQYQSQRSATTSVTVLNGPPSGNSDCASCVNNAGCASFVCTGGICQPPACSPTCNRGAPCGANRDCGSGVCTNGLCAPAACAPKCNAGATCGDNSDCASSVCTNNVCAAPSCSPTCNQGAPCGANGDCGSQVCTNGICQAPACAPKCGAGAACNNNGDCASSVCTNNVCQAGSGSSGGTTPPACSPSCSDGNPCTNNNQCASFVCAAGVCAPPSCSPTCNQGAPCGANGDCGSQVCSGGTCKPPACSPKCSSGSPCNNNGDCSSFVCVNSRCE